MSASKGSEKIELIFRKGLFKVKRWMSGRINVSRNGNTDERHSSLDDLILLFIFQVIFTWILQDSRLLNDDPRYLLTMVTRRPPKGHERHVEFFKELFTVMLGTDPKSDDHVQHLHVKNHPRLGRILITGKMFFLVDPTTFSPFWNVNMPNDAFYITDYTISWDDIISDPAEAHVKPFPLLNFLESWQRYQGPVDGFLVGSMLEHLGSPHQRRQQGQFFTPKQITLVMARNALTAWLRERLKKLGHSLDAKEDALIKADSPEMIRDALNALLQVTILDPAMGSGHFLEACARVYMDTFISLLQRLKETVTSLRDQATRLWIDDTWNHLTRTLMNKMQTVFSFPENPDSDPISHHVVMGVKQWLLGEVQDLDRHSLQFILMYHHVLPHVLHGVDLNPLAPRWTRIRLMLLLLQWGSRVLRNHAQWSIMLTPQHFNLHQGNTLVGLLRWSQCRHVFLSTTLSTAEMRRVCNEQMSHQLNIPLAELDALNPLHWPLLTCREPRAGSSPLIGTSRNNEHRDPTFDLIIGNPPYVSAKSLPKNVKFIMKRLYQTAKGQYDLFSLFIERSLQLSSEGGIISFILPDAVLDRSTFAPIRQLILKNTTIISIHCITNVFDDPTVSNVIVTLHKQKASFRHHVAHAHHESLSDFIASQQPSEFTPQRWFITTRKHAFLLLPAKDRQLVNKIQHVATQRLGSVVHIFRGEELGKKSPLVTRTPHGSEWKPLLVGSDIRPFLLNAPRHYLHVDSIQKCGYFHPKVVVRQLGKRIHAAVDHGGQYVTVQAVYNLIVTNPLPKDTLPSVPSPPAIHPRFVAALLNSHVMNYYYAVMFQHKKLFPRILIENLRDLPFKMPPPEMHDFACDLVRQIEVTLARSKTLDERVMSTAQTIRAQLEAVLFHLYQISVGEMQRILTHLQVNEKESRLITSHLVNLKNHI